MAFAYLNNNAEIKEQYQTALNLMSEDFNSWRENERIADALPDSKENDQMQITDSTVASYIMTKPRELAREIPVGRSSLPGKEDLEDLLSEILYVNILPHANSDGDVLLKYQQMFENCYTYGYGASWAFTKYDGEYYGADFIVLNPREVILEAGKKNPFACNYVFIRQYFQPKDIEAIIYKEEEIAKLAKQDDEEYASTWNLDLLRKIAEEKGSAKPQDAVSSIEERKSNKVDSIELVYCFQKGVGNSFYVINANAANEAEVIVREYKNPDPRGAMPIDFMIIDSSIRKPTGRSIMDFVGPTHRLLERQLSRYEFNQDLRSQPPMGVRGNLEEMDIDSFSLEARTLWYFGANPNNSVEPIKIPNNDNFLASDFGILKGQMLNYFDNSDHSISATVGDPEYSKTPAGIMARRAKSERSDEHAERRGKDWFSRLAETLINLHIAENDDTENVKLREAYIERQKMDNPDYDKTEEEIDYSELKGIVARFQLDTTSSTKQEDDLQKLEIMQQMFKDLISSRYVLSGQVNIRGYLIWLFKQLGIENYEDILPTENPEEQTANEQEINNPAEEIPTENDNELEEELANNGLSPEQIKQVEGAINA